jgi:hypothetical protein
MNGGRYRVERYMPNAEDSDPEEAEQRELEDMFRSSSSDEEESAERLIFLLLFI